MDGIKNKAKPTVHNGGLTQDFIQDILSQALSMAVEILLDRYYNNKSWPYYFFGLKLQ